MFLMKKTLTTLRILEWSSNEHLFPRLLLIPKWDPTAHFQSSGAFISEADAFSLGIVNGKVRAFQNREDRGGWGKSLE